MVTPPLQGVAAFGHIAPPVCVCAVVLSVSRASMLVGDGSYKSSQQATHACQRLLQHSICLRHVLILAAAACVPHVYASLCIVLDPMVALSPHSCQY
jgi:hypothetical protein